MGCMGMGWGVLSGWPATEETPAGRDISGLLCGSAVIMSRQIVSSDNTVYQLGTTFAMSTGSCCVDEQAQADLVKDFTLTQCHANQGWCHRVGWCRIRTGQMKGGAGAAHCQPMAAGAGEGP